MDEMKDGHRIVSRNGMTTCACGPGCTCGCGHYFAHRVFWWVAALVLLAGVFCLGVKAGEFRSELRSAFSGYYYRTQGYPMMQRYYDSSALPAQGNATGTQGLPVQQ